MNFSRLSLLWKILIPTSLVMTVAFAITGWLVERSVVRTTYASVEQEAKASFQAYESLWKARADLLASVSEILSTMSDVRAAFSTRDQSTIRDTAGELWSKVSSEDAFFLVSDGQGRVIANLGAPASFAPNDDLPMVRTALSRFPKQASGVVQNNDQLFQVVITPVYVQSGGGPALLNVLVAGYKVDEGVAQRLKNSTGGSEYVFVSHGRVVTSTLAPEATAAITAAAPKRRERQRDVGLSGAAESAARHQRRAQPGSSSFCDPSPAPGSGWLGFDARCSRFGCWRWWRRWRSPTWSRARSCNRWRSWIVRPPKSASRISIIKSMSAAKTNWDGLAETFQIMCESIRQAREELIRRERIATIGQLSTSIVHDLRNPLAAIYAGAEMLVDSNLPEEQTRRLARNIYRASRGIQDMLQQLLDVSRGRSGGGEMCSLSEVIAAAWASAPARYRHPGD